MAYDEGTAALMRDDLTEHGPLVEKRMFGGLCFMLNGNMLCGVHKDGGMYRTGKDNHAAALQIDGVSPMTFTGRPMGGFVEADEDLLAHDENRTKLLGLALDFVQSLPPK